MNKDILPKEVVTGKHRKNTKSFSKTKYLRTAPDISNLKELVKKDLEAKISSNEMENLHFYDIPVNPLDTKTKGVYQFHSQNNFADNLQIKNMKFFKKPKYNHFEREAIMELKKQNGALLFLSEM